MTAAERSIAHQEDMGDTYISPVLSPVLRNGLMGDALALLRGKVVPTFDAIAISGNSGLFGAMLAFALDLPLIIVRKDGQAEKSHGRQTVEGPVVPQRVLLVDDFVRTGATLRRMWEQLGERGHRVVGIYLYRDHLRNSSLKTAVLPAVDWWAFGLDSFEQYDEMIAAVLKSPEVSNL